MAEQEWIAGYGHGVTGPTCPSVAGPTCGQAVKLADFDAGGRAQPPEDEYTIVSEGSETVAIIPFPNGTDKKEAERRARLIAAAPALRAACEFAAEPNAPFSTDKLEFANRIIKAIMDKANAALAQAKEAK